MSDTSPHEALNSLQSVQQRLVELLSSCPRMGDQLAQPTAGLAEIYGIYLGGDMPDQESVAMMLRFSDVVSGLLGALEKHAAGTSSTSLVANPSSRELLADLLELQADDDHGYYDSGVIDEIRARARKILIEG